MIFNFLEDPPVDFLAMFCVFLTIVRSDQRRDQIRGGKKKGGGERGEIGLRWDQTEAGLASGGGIGWRRDRTEAGSDGGGIGRRHRIRPRWREGRSGQDGGGTQDQSKAERSKIKEEEERGAGEKSERDL
jgi:hypothetical protein